MAVDVDVAMDVAVAVAVAVVVVTGFVSVMGGTEGPDAGGGGDGAKPTPRGGCLLCVWRDVVGCRAREEWTAEAAGA